MGFTPTAAAADLNRAYHAAPQDQVDDLNAIHRQLGGRLRFWMYLLLDDINPETYASVKRDQGMEAQGMDTLSFFVSVGLGGADGSPKPALRVWDEFRNGGPEATQPTR